MNPYSRIKLAGLELSGLASAYAGRYGRLKDANARLARVKAATGDDSLQTHPIALTLQDTSACNLRCPHCATHGTPAAHAFYKGRCADHRHLQHRRVGKGLRPGGSASLVQMNKARSGSPHAEEAYGPRVRVRSDAAPSRLPAQTASGMRAMTLISKSKPASQVTPTAVQLG